jgi:hypothetical protein
MATSSTFEDLFSHPSMPEERPEPQPAGRFQLPAYLSSTEEWITFALIALVQFPVVSSLESTNWVDEMPSLFVASLVAFLGAWVLTHTRLRARYVALGGVALGAAVTIAQVMHTMRLADPLLGTGVRARWSEFWVRLRDWGNELVTGGVSTDELPFVVMLVFVVFAVSFISTWSVVRWRNAWIALVPGGFVLLTNISYLPGQPSFQFIFFLFAGALLITRMHFRRSEQRWDEERIAPPELMSLEVLFVSAWVGLILIIGAWIVPTANNWGPVADTWDRVFEPVNDRIDRFGQLFIGVGSKENRPVHTLGGSLPLRGGIRLSEAEIYRVTTDDEGYLRGATYNVYLGNGWKVENGDAVAQLPTSVEAAEFGNAATLAQFRLPVTAEIRIVGDGPTNRVLALGEALAADTESQAVLDDSRNPIALVPDGRLSVGDSYTSVGARSEAAIATLVAAGTAYPQEIRDNYLALPDSVPATVYDLAEAITGEAGSPYEAAALVVAWLRSEFPYSLAVDGPPPGADATEHFLFVEQAGYFDHFASAMAVMLRTRGIPTRVSVGFVLDEANIDPDTKEYILTEESAFAWTEVYFPGLGWIEFNPTPAPGRSLVARPGDDAEIRADLAALRDQNAISDELEELLFDEILGLEPNGGASALLGDEEPSDDGFVGAAGAALVRALTFFVIIGVVVVALVLAVRAWWAYQFRTMTGATARWGKVMRLAAIAGIDVPAHRTPNEAMVDLTPLLGEPTALRRLGESYTLERYGESHEETEHEVEVLEAAYRRVRSRLWRLAVRRFLPLVRARNQLASHRPS